MKVLSLYLPQYHEVEENNIWWGKGFTDWDTVKSANRLFDEHKQPKVPNFKNYYDLADINSLRWQAELMKKYSVDGQIFYHYCFKDNKLILEKPAELLLENKDISMPFCFCWANESWVNSWSNIKGGNVWSYKFGNKIKGSDYLLEQQYGEETQWVDHFNYLLPFFKDERYIRKDNKPIFLIYRAEIMPCLSEMKLCWDRLAKENGLDGIYFIAGNYGLDNCQYIDAFYEHEPRGSKNLAPFVKEDNLPYIIDYDDIWRLILANSPRKENTIFGGFVNYDDTPRHGTQGTVIVNSTPAKFQQYLEELMAKNEVYGSDFTIINAWNEWGEGMYLEPDKENGFGYLNAIKNAKENYKAYNSKYLLRKKYNLGSISENLQKSSSKDLEYIKIIDDWLKLKQQNFNLSKYFTQNVQGDIYIYGIGKLGRALVNEIKDYEVIISGIIDRSIKNEYEGIPIFKLGDSISADSTIVIALSYDVDIVKDNLIKEYGDSVKILELKKIIRKCLEDLDEH